MSGRFEFVRGNYELPVLFFYFTEKVVQLCRVLGLQKILNDGPSGIWMSRQKLRQSQVVPIVIGQRVDRLRGLQEWDCLCKLAGTT